MTNDIRTVRIRRRTPESAAMATEVRRAMTITAALNRLRYGEADQVRALLSELVGERVDDSVTLIPPFYATGGTNMRLGSNLFINQNCTFYDLGGIEIGDDVMIGPNVSLLTSSHPLSPAERPDGVIAKPIRIGRNVWIAAGATIVGGVSIGENAVVAAGSVVTKDVPPDTLVAGNPARIVRSIAD